MKVVAAYLLAVLGGNASPSADDLKVILGSVGAEADDDRIELLLSEPSSFSSAATFPLSFPRYQSKNEGGRRLLVCRTQRKRFSFADNLKVILRSGVEPKKRGKGAGELNFIIMEAASCSLELCEVSPDS
ncbi:hypothetical protein GOBAR_AA12746 [Gossypium barbadense]|uniref:Uncharacterized protein n=1 Tax=Gossypium barbadense TaxID=3634 RepID=A0A2P5XX29_GOSBA|nr:hypothetical protein GOBAR_AA12746 [Gossypium barbadense]